ncbi:stage VI sporulation protein F [Shouchella shacheensis]|uniref:stage VI sporulation protein F n=1 Tax=Shouchella shacheensis TaxID=1649580 RepID=UPI0007401089|nr:stage VI sporulation protein F [Shouchella shacheensis]
MSNNNHLFDMINQKGVKTEDLFALANSLKNENFQDRQTVRRIIREVARLANRPVSREKEDRLVETIVNGKAPKDLASLANMLKS